MSGTAELAEDFFPVSMRVARYWLPWLWDRVFPAYGALLCPKPFFTIQVSTEGSLEGGREWLATRLIVMSWAGSEQPRRKLNHDWV